MLMAMAACGADGGLAAELLSLVTAAGADVDALRVGCGGGGGGGGPESVLIPTIEFHPVSNLVFQRFSLTFY